MPFLAGLFLGVVFLAAAGGIEKRVADLDRTDFSGFWAGARTVLAGHDVYDGPSFRMMSARLGTQAPDRDVFTYPPYVTVGLVPFGLLPLRVSADLWMLGGLAAASLGLRAVVHRYVPQLPAVHSLAGFLLLGSQPGVLTFVHGQWSFWLIGAWCAVAMAWRGRAEARGGVAALCLLAKPQLIVFAAVGVLRGLVARRRTRFASGFLTGALLLMAVSFYGGIGPWLEWARGIPAARSGEPRVTTLPAALADLVGPTMGPLLAVGLLVLGLLAAWRFDPGTDAAFAVWVSLSFAFAVYSRSYDHVQLLVPLVVGTGALARGSPRAAVSVMVAASLVLFAGAWILFQVVAPARQSESFAAAVPMTIFVLLTCALWPLRRAATSPLSRGGGTDPAGA
ncbi:MAG: glycosyltransferase family 87 protein [Thermoleophilaceae bacterium]